MTDIHEKDLQNTSNNDQQKNITNRTESSITESLSKNSLTLDQKMDKIIEGMQNMNNGVNQILEVFKQMIKVQIETTNTTNKMITEQTHTINESMIEQLKTMSDLIIKKLEKTEKEDIIITLELIKNKAKSENFKQTIEKIIRTQNIHDNSFVLLE